jgi:hypothetical protein
MFIPKACFLILHEVIAPFKMGSTFLVEGNKYETNY